MKISVRSVLSGKVKRVTPGEAANTVILSSNVMAAAYD
jgi:molybdopterin-binding protein